MPKLSQKNHHFSVEIKWLEGTKTVVKKKVVDRKTESLEVTEEKEEIRQVETKAIGLDIPAIWGGKGQGWCSDELFSASIGNCLFATFYDFVKRAELTG